MFFRYFIALCFGSLISFSLSGCCACMLLVSPSVTISDSPSGFSLFPQVNSSSTQLFLLRHSPGVLFSFLPFLPRLQTKIDSSVYYRHIYQFTTRLRLFLTRRTAIPPILFPSLPSNPSITFSLGLATSAKLAIMIDSGARLDTIHLLYLRQTAQRR